MERERSGQKLTRGVKVKARIKQRVRYVSFSLSLPLSPSHMQFTKSASNIKFCPIISLFRFLMTSILLLLNLFSTPIVSLYSDSLLSSMSRFRLTKVNKFKHCHGLFGPEGTYGKINVAEMRERQTGSE